MEWTPGGKRLHGDHTPVSVLAKRETGTGWAWVYVRDDAPFGGADTPASLFYYSRDRSGDHPPAAADAQIAAVAIQHELILVTRNVKDFGNFDIQLLDPWLE